MIARLLQPRTTLGSLREVIGDFGALRLVERLQSILQQQVFIDMWH